MQSRDGNLGTIVRLRLSSELSSIFRSRFVLVCGPQMNGSEPLKPLGNHRPKRFDAVKYSSCAHPQAALQLESYSGFTKIISSDNVPIRV